MGLEYAYSSPWGKRRLPGDRWRDRKWVGVKEGLLLIWRNPGLPARVAKEAGAECVPLSNVFDRQLLADSWSKLPGRRLSGGRLSERHLLK